MKTSFQESNNAKVISRIEKNTGAKFINDEVFKGKNNGHKFSVGQKCRLFGLEDYPEFNGEIIEITSIREDGAHGKAYYFKAINPLVAKQLNWTYEYRLEL
jgi:hypothetical protein